MTRGLAYILRAMSHVKITEGKACILFPSSNEVFYNPVQEFNRDLSIAVIKRYSEHLWKPGNTKKKIKPEDVGKEKTKSEEDEGVAATASAAATNSSTATTSAASSGNEGLKILEALAASGLRSIRYALEIPRVETVLANDFSEKAFHSMQSNVEHNGLQGKVVPSMREASMLMYEHREPVSERFDVIDLDPYGSPSQFLDSTVQSVKDGGLLCVTCTDMSVLCGTHSESCHSKYGSMSIKSKFCHEMALRIVLSSLESHANRYRRYIVPLLSCSVDFYIRMFVRVFTSAQEVKRSPSKLAMVYHCIGCESFHFQSIGKRIEAGKSKKYPPGTGPPVDKKCDQCGSVFRLGGPIWSDPLHDKAFVQDLLAEVADSPPGMYRTKERIKGLLTVVSEEVPDAPLYHVLDSVCSTLHCDTPSMLALRSAILDQGYRVSLSHANPKAIKTDAPQSVFWDIMRCWVKKCTVKTPSPTSPAAALLATEPKLQACFDIRKDANPPSRLLKLSRFPENPEANWGPKPRAKRKGGDVDEDMVVKRKRLQGKRTNPTDTEEQKTMES